MTNCMARRYFFRGLLFLMTLWLIGPTSGLAGTTVHERFPHLATGVLKSASLAELGEGVILVAADFRMTESEIEELVGKADRKIRHQLNKHLFYVLEEKASEKLIASEAYKAGYGKTKNEGRVAKAFLQHRFSGMEVSDDEIRKFYEENKATIGVPFEQAREVVSAYVVREKTNKAIRDYITDLGKDAGIQVDSSWVKQQYELAKDNPVDKARNSGKPTMVEFGATGCKPCDMMQPILKKLRKKYGDKLNILFIHVRDDQILAARYSIASIPVQVFFDKTGKEFFRHVGFFPQNEVEKKISEMGDVINETSS